MDRITLKGTLGMISEKTIYVAYSIADFIENKDAFRTVDNMNLDPLSVIQGKGSFFRNSYIIFSEVNIISGNEDKRTIIIYDCLGNESKGSSIELVPTDTRYLLGRIQNQGIDENERIRGAHCLYDPNKDITYMVDLYKETDSILEQTQKDHTKTERRTNLNPCYGIR